MSRETVGIPRALLYHYYYPLWESFFRKLGFKVVISSETNKSILNAGISTAVDEACLPVKVFYGHVLELVDQVDYLFLPRIVSVEQKEYMCPKLMGLPDMLRAALVNPPSLIDVTVNLRNKDKTKEVMRSIAQIINVPESRAQTAWKWALARQNEFDRYLAGGKLPLGFEPQGSTHQIALLGHGYNIYDKFISMNLIKKLQELGAEVCTKEMVPQDVIEEYAAKLPKKMFWTFGKRLLGSGLYYLQQSKIQGIIFVASFGCGPDSMVGELLERWARRENGKPFLLVTIDEHTGETGLITRIEAFMDMIQRKVS